MLGWQVTSSINKGLIPDLINCSMCVERIVIGRFDGWFTITAIRIQLNLG